MSRTTLVPLAAATTVVAVLLAPIGASSAATTVPAGCVAHTPWGSEDDLPNDYRCAGLRISYHTGGVALGSGRTWAGQWLFIDEQGNYRRGLCTFHRGTHPRADIRSSVVDQSFPNDPTGAKRAYLTWRYGDTTDNLTAAALWAVFHYYAQDAAGSNAGVNASDPLVPSLTSITRNSGRQDLQDLAIALDAEASLYGRPYAVTVSLESPDRGVARVTAGGGGVPGVRVELDVTGATFTDGTTTTAGTTDGNGDVPFVLTTGDGSVTVVVRLDAPGASQVYRGVAADAGSIAQTLLTAGSPTPLSATATVEPPPTTTTVPETTTTSTVPETTTTTTVPETTTTTTVPETTTTTTVPETSTTIPETTTTLPDTTLPDTTLPDTTPSVPAEPVVSAAPPEPVTTVPTVPVTQLPKTGTGDLAGYLATALLVGGVGIVGAVRRATALAEGDELDRPGGDPGFW